MPSHPRLFLSALALASVSLTACVEEDGAAPGAPLLVAPTAVDLGAGDCGAAATGRFTIGNDGDAPMPFTLESIDPRVAVVPAAGTIAPGEAQAIEVRAAVPAEAAAGDDFATAIVARTEGADARTIAIGFAARGAMLAIEPPTIAIGQQPVGLRTARGFTVRNDGDAAATIAIAAPGGEFGGGLAGIELAPGASHTGEMTYLPRDLGADRARAAIAVTGAVCGARPTALALAGEGVPGDGILVQGGPIDFGTVGCDGRDATRTLTLVNPTDVDGTFTAMMWDSDLDDLNFEVSPPRGTVPARGQVELTVRRRDAHGPGSPRVLDTAVRVVTVLGAQEIHDVPVHEILQTAELRLTGETDFGWLPANTFASSSVTITNTGTAPARLAVAAPAALTAALPAWLAPGETAVGWVSYRAETTTPFTGTLSVTAVGSCQRPVERVYTAGRGGHAVLAPVETISTCGAPPASTVRFWVSNPGTAALLVSCRAAGPSPLTVIFPSSSILVGANGRAFFDVALSSAVLTPGSLTAPVECIANDGPRATWESHETTITRTIVAPDEHCDDVIVTL